MVKWLSRFGVFFFCGNSVLLVLEVINPFFGFWHSFSESMMILFSVSGSSLLQYYSKRMINDIWLEQDGSHVEVQFMNAFF